MITKSFNDRSNANRYANGMRAKGLQATVERRDPKSFAVIVADAPEAGDEVPPKQIAAEPEAAASNVVQLQPKRRTARIATINRKEWLAACVAEKQAAQSAPRRGPSPATLGAEAVKADDAARDARKAAVQRADARRSDSLAGLSLDDAAAAAISGAPGRVQPKAKAQSASPRAPSLAPLPIGRDGMPTPPDFSKPTHKGYRPKLARLVELAKAGDIAGLKAFPVEPVSNSRRALWNYRNACVAALEARKVRA